MSEFQKRVITELAKARLKHPRKMNSLHEAYAVILEEVEELWGETRIQSPERDKELILEDLIQIAAMAQRAAEDLGLIDREGQQELPIQHAIWRR